MRAGRAPGKHSPIHTHCQRTAMSQGPIWLQHHSMQWSYPPPPPRPLVIPHPLQSPPPPWGGPSPGPKSIGNTRRQRRRRKFFFRLHWNWGRGGPSLGDRPPPSWGDRPDIRGGITRGAGGSFVTHASLHRCWRHSDGWNNSGCDSALESNMSSCCLGLGCGTMSAALAFALPGLMGPAKGAVGQQRRRGEPASHAASSSSSEGWDSNDSKLRKHFATGLGGGASWCLIPLCHISLCKGDWMPGPPPPPRPIT